MLNTIDTTYINIKFSYGELSPRQAGLQESISFSPNG